jgi:macrodomain Ter protein organizer (MatP/YcbG family)
MRIFQNSNNKDIGLIRKKKKGEEIARDVEKSQERKRDIA